MTVERIVVSVDVACFALDGAALRLLLVRRQEPPFAGSWALPGGVVGGREALDAAAARVLAERTRLAVAYLEQLYTFGDPDRDPRGRAISVAYYAVLPLAAGPEPATRPGRAVAAVAWAPVDDLPPLAFDHGAIAAYARRRLAQKLTDTPLAFRLLPEKFTLAALRRVHEAIEGRAYPHASNFQALMRARWDLARVPGEFAPSGRRPAQLYRYAGPRAIPGPPEPPPGDPVPGH